MARLGPYLALVACIGVACLAGAAFADGPPKASPRRADIPLIKCALCERLATKAWRSGRALLKTSTPAKRVDELAVVELIEKLGTPWRPEGEWLTQLDIVREGKALALVDKDQIGECNTTCKTLAAAAEDILGSHDTDIAEMIYVGSLNRQKFTHRLCWELSRSCGGATPAVPAGWKPAGSWRPKQAGSQDLDQMMAQMEESGMKGRMYSREELQEQMEDYQQAIEDLDGGEAGPGDGGELKEKEEL